MLEAHFCDGKVNKAFNELCLTKSHHFRIYTDRIELQQQDSLSLNLLRASHKFKLSGLMGESYISPHLTAIWKCYRRSLRTSVGVVGERSNVCRLLLCCWRVRSHDPPQPLLVADLHQLERASASRLRPHDQRTAPQDAQVQDQASATFRNSTEKRRRGLPVPGGKRGHREWFYQIFIQFCSPDSRVSEFHTKKVNDCFRDKEMKFGSF